MGKNLHKTPFLRKNGKNTRDHFQNLEKKWCRQVEGRALLWVRWTGKPCGLWRYQCRAQADCYNSTQHVRRHMDITQKLVKLLKLYHSLERVTKRSNDLQDNTFIDIAYKAYSKHENARCLFVLLTEHQYNSLEDKTGFCLY